MPFCVLAYEGVRQLKKSHKIEHPVFDLPPPTVSTQACQTHVMLMYDNACQVSTPNRALLPFFGIRRPFGEEIEIFEKETM